MGTGGRPWRPRRPGTPPPPPNVPPVAEPGWPIVGAKLEIEPLCCPQCGSGVPLGSGPRTHCRHCDVDVTIPEEYHRLQRTQQSALADRKLAEELYGRIGRPPGLAARLGGRAAEGSIAYLKTAGAIVGVLLGTLWPLGVALFMVAGYGISYPTAKLLHLGFRLAGQPLDPLPPELVVPLATILAYLLLGVPAILSARERALGDVRRDIHASLAAVPPVHDGGAFACRRCGAALDVPADALGVPCAYCKVDNLVALPRGWVADAQASEYERFLSIDACLEAYRAAARRATESTWRMLLWLVFSLPLAVFVGYLLDQMNVTF